MAVGIRDQYYCTNVAACQYSATDHPYSRKDFERGKGVCIGCSNDGCQQPLVKGDPRNARIRYLSIVVAILIAISAAGFGIKQQFFPEPLDHITFDKPQTRTPDTVGMLTVVVTRDREIDHQLAVEYTSADGTARAGQDYQPVKGELIFAPGEREKRLLVPILPDTEFDKPDRYFSVILSNVANTPRLVVFIEQRHVDASERDRVEQTVRTASVVAMDIASDVVRHRVLSELVANNRQDHAAYEQFKTALDTVEGNLTRARERYVQLFKDMQTMQPRIVLTGMDAVSAYQAQEGYKQQSLATTIMKRQLQEYLSSGNLSMDRWAQELSAVVPRPDRKDLSTST